MEKQFVSFTLSDRKYCLDIMDVKEVVRENDITVMPDSPSYVSGIMNLRGIVIPVISLRKKLGLPETEGKTAPEGTKKKNNKLIIASVDSVLIGFVVDALDRVFSLEEGQIQASERVSDSGIDRTLIAGVAKLEDDLFLILDVKKILDLEEREFIQKEIVE